MEKWKEIPGYEGAYLISSRGRVKSLKRKGKTKNIILKTATSKGKKRKEGYHTVALSMGGISSTHFIHRIVAKVFLKKPKGIWQINHKDGNKLNNSVENLEWCTCKKNILHATKSGLRYAKLTSDKVEEIKNKYSKGNQSQGAIAKEYGVNQSVISRIINKRSWNHE